MGTGAILSRRLPWAGVHRYRHSSPQQQYNIFEGAALADRAASAMKKAVCEPHVRPEQGNGPRHAEEGWLGCCVRICSLGPNPFQTCRLLERPGNVEWAQRLCYPI